MHRGNKVNEALVRSCTMARLFMRLHCAPAKGLGVQCGPGALLRRGHDFHEYPVRSCKGATIAGAKS